MGLHFLGLTRIGLLMREGRLTAPKPVGLWGAYVMGLAFAFGWTPCIGPILAAILSVAAAEATVTKGAMLLAVYSAGLGIPFLLAAFTIEQFSSLFARMKRHLHTRRARHGCADGHHRHRLPHRRRLQRQHLAAGDFSRTAKFRLRPRNKRAGRSKLLPDALPPSAAHFCAHFIEAAARVSRHDNIRRGLRMNSIVNLLILLPARIASHFAWAGPLIMRLIVGYTFMLSGWGKLNNLPQITQNFIEWGILFPKILTPFVSGVEFFGGIMLILGLFTRIPAAMLAFTMLVAIKSAKWGGGFAGDAARLRGSDLFRRLHVARDRRPRRSSLDRLLVNAAGHREAIDLKITSLSRDIADTSEPGFARAA